MIGKTDSISLSLEYNIINKDRRYSADKEGIPEEEYSDMNRIEKTINNLISVSPEITLSYSIDKRIHDSLEIAKLNLKGSRDSVETALRLLFASQTNENITNVSGNKAAIGLLSEIINEAQYVLKKNPLSRILGYKVVPKEIKHSSQQAAYVPSLTERIS